ncbi:MAG TPA: hypothetical protein VLM17_07380 [Xanthomonadaceae bacterium]|nr:hypothetical protein [Xanthomonadaceae bacterium]
MYRLGNIHLRLEHVTMVFPVHPLLGQEGVHGFDVMVGGYLHTAKYLDGEAARRAHAALLAALEPAVAVPEAAPVEVATPAPMAPAPSVAAKGAGKRKAGKPDAPRSRH